MEWLHGSRSIFYFIHVFYDYCQNFMWYRLLFFVSLKSYNSLIGWLTSIYRYLYEIICSLESMCGQDVLDIETSLSIETTKLNLHLGTLFWILKFNAILNNMILKRK